MERAYYLSADAFSCTVGRYCIFLDLASDRYLCTDRSVADVLATADPPVDSEMSSSDGDSAVRIANALLERGLLTLKPADGKPLSHIPITTRATLTNAIVGKAPAPLWRLAPAFLYTCCKSMILLRRWSIRSIIRRAEEAKVQYRHRNAHGQRESALLLADAFRRLRPAFPTKQICLRDSMMLWSFLTHFGIYPSWVFGVRIDPFHAHCWLEFEDTVLNDDAIAVTHYHPILKI